MIAVNCKEYAQEILDWVRGSEKRGKLVILTVGENPASQSYVKGKIKDCEYCGIDYEHIVIDFKSVEYASEKLRKAIFNANIDDSVAGIIVQLPLPDGMNEELFTNMVIPSKDVDGFVPDSPYKPCTPEGVIHVMKKQFGANLSGKTVTLVGKGRLVGKPLIPMLLDEGCTLTICTSRTTNLWKFLDADCVISAVGKAGLIDCKDCSSRLLIDVGVNRVNGKLCGDFYNHAECEESNAYYTKVPGGIGLLTRAMLMSHMV